MKWTTKYVVTAITLRGYIIGYDARNGNCLYKFAGHTNTIYEFIHDAVESSIVTASDDGTVKIFSLPALGDM